MVLLVHNRYRTTGGEERAVADLRWLVGEHMGEPVEVLERDSARLSRARAAAGMLRGGTHPEELAEPGQRERARHQEGVGGRAQAALLAGEPGPVDRRLRARVAATVQPHAGQGVAPVAARAVLPSREARPDRAYQPVVVQV